MYSPYALFPSYVAFYPFYPTLQGGLGLPISDGFFAHQSTAFCTPFAVPTDGHGAAGSVVEPLASFQPPAQPLKTVPSGRATVPEGAACAICSDVAIRHNYGAVSCNGCKCFFRRMVVGALAGTLRCQYENNCDVKKEARNACRHCRFQKCLRAGMDVSAPKDTCGGRSATRNAATSVRNRAKIPEGALCLVCNDLATGYHYGGASCSGCKTFFRRSMVAGRAYVCEREGNCSVKKNDPTVCHACRFSKCLQAGMDVSAPLARGSYDRRPSYISNETNAIRQATQASDPALQFEPDIDASAALASA